MSSFELNHIALSVKNVEVSTAFYQKVFQLKEIKNTASNSKTRWLIFADKRQLHLIPRPEAKIKTNKAVHFALSAINLEAVKQHLDSLGVEFSDWKNTPDKNYVRDDGIQQIYLQDPDGYWIEVNDDNF